jgi:hypothetical protein
MKTDLVEGYLKEEVPQKRGVCFGKEMVVYNLCVVLMTSLLHLGYDLNLEL